MNKTNLTRSELNRIFNDFSDVSYTKHNTMAYEAGAYQSMLVGILAELPRSQQEKHLSFIRHMTPSITESSSK